MHVGFAALFIFGILTLWVPGYWPVTIFQVGIFGLAGMAVWRARLTPLPFAWPLVPLSFAVMWGVGQLLAGLTAYAFDTTLAVLRWATFLSAFVIGLSIFQDEAVRCWFRSAMLWLAFLLAVLATLQTFTSHGKVFWLFTTPYTENVMGPFLSRNGYAAFVEAVLPVALYEAVLRSRNALLYSGMAAAMYASVIASASRAGTVLTSMEIVAVPLLLWGFHRTTGRGVAATLLRMGLFFASFTAVVGWESVWIRFWTPDPLGVRRELALSSIQMVMSHPWSGTGLGTWATVYPRYAIVDVGALANQAHNDWLQWTAEGGLPFGMMLGTLFLWSIRPALRSVWGLGALAVFLHALVDYPFSRPALGSWPIVILALLACTTAEPEDSASKLVQPTYHAAGD